MGRELDEAATEQALSSHEVNLFVAHDADGSAPVVVETNPTYPNLFGRIEHHGVLGGGFVTDHRILRPGAIHRANGGYLMLPAAEVLTQPFGMAEAQGGTAHAIDPFRERGRAVRAVPNGDAHAGADRTGSQGRAGRIAAALRACVHAG